MSAGRSKYMEPKIKAESATKVEEKSVGRTRITDVDAGVIAKICDNESLVVCTDKGKEGALEYMEANATSFMTEEGAKMVMTESVPCESNKANTHFIFKLQ